MECPHCGETISLFGSGGGEKTALNSGIPLLGKIPFDPKMVLCGDSGACYQDEFKDSDVTKAFQSVADKVAELA